MNPIRLLIADIDPEFLSLAEKHLTKKAGFDLVGFSRDGHDALQKVRLSEPDVLLTGMLLPSIDGLTLLREIHAAMRHPPIIVVCSRFYSDASIDAARESGASFLLYKPVMPATLISVLQVAGRAALHCRTDAALPSDENKRLVSEALTALQFSPRHSGTEYIAEAVLLAMKSRDVPASLTKMLYPEIACCMSTTPLRIERCIRTAIACAYAKGAMKEIFHARPTNGEVIRYLAARLSR